MAKGNNYCCYAVREGRRPGLYYNWADCEKQVKRYSGARFKGFGVERDAIAWLAKAGIAREQAPTRVLRLARPPARQLPSTRLSTTAPRPLPPTRGGPSTPSQRAGSQAYTTTGTTAASRSMASPAPDTRSSRHSPRPKSSVPSTAAAATSRCSSRKTSSPTKRPPLATSGPVFHSRRAGHVAPGNTKSSGPPPFGTRYKHTSSPLSLPSCLWSRMRSAREPPAS